MKLATFALCALAAAAAAQAACVDTDSPGGYSCAQQKSWGKCGEPWMAGKCDATCGKCGAKTALETAKEAEGAEQDTLIAGLAAAAKLKKNGTWLWKKNITKLSLEADAADLAAPEGIAAASKENADDETLIAGAIAAKLLALKKNSTWLAAKFNKTKFAAEDVDAVEKADDADTLIAGMAIASKLAKLNKTGLLAAKWNKTAKFAATEESVEEAIPDAADDEVLISSAINKVLRLKNATKFAAAKNWTKFASEEIASDVPELEVNDYHMLKAFNKSWATSALAFKFNLTAAAFAAAKNKTVKGL